MNQVSSALRGHVLAEDVTAPSDVPSTSTTNVDGYALRGILPFSFSFVPDLTHAHVAATYPLGVYKVLTTDPEEHLPELTVFRVNTGGPIPPGADAVIMVEDTVVKSTLKDQVGRDLEETEIETLVRIPKGENVRLPGSDVKAGDLVFSEGAILDGLGGDVGTLAFVGKKEVRISLATHTDVASPHDKTLHRRYASFANPLSQS